jgi:hypothetical protein
MIARGAGASYNRPDNIITTRMTTTMAAGDQLP